MKPNKNWSDKKPTQPGEYLVKWGKNHLRGRKPNESHVTVTRKGRGLSVFCPAYNDRVPMSDIGDDELQWRKVE